MYNKLFTKILDSSIWLESDHIRLVWITFLAVMDKDGIVLLSGVGNVANRARVTEELAADAIKCLESPDKKNPDQEHEGRRIERIPGMGWTVLNAKKYQDIVRAETARMQNRERVKAFRERNGSVMVCNDLVTPSPSVSPSVSVSDKTIAQPTDGFAEKIYESYPRKVARKSALRAIKNALKKEDHEALLQKTIAYAKAREGADPQFTPHPATWFNRESYNDNPKEWNLHANTSKNNQQPPQRVNRAIGTANEGVSERYRTLDLEQLAKAQAVKHTRS
jgi:hypothetical protein